jgi:hypothetical protein
MRDNARTGNFYRHPAQKGGGAAQPDGINIKMKRLYFLFRVVPL